MFVKNIMMRPSPSPPHVTVTYEKKDETTEHTEHTKCGAILW